MIASKREGGAVPKPADHDDVMGDAADNAATRTLKRPLSKSE